MGQEPRRPAFFWVTVLASGVYAVLLTFSIYANVRYYGVRKYPGWSVRLNDSGWVVGSVDSKGPAAGRLEPGDRLLAVNGDPRSAVLGFYQLRAVNPGDTYGLEIERGDVRSHVDLTLAERQASPLQPIFIFYSVIFFACGAGLALLRPGDPQVRLFGGALMMVGGGLLIDALGAANGCVSGWERAGYFVILCFGGWAFPMTYHSISRFPTWESPGPLWRAIQWLLYAVFAFVWWPAWMAPQLVSVVRAEGLNSRRLRAGAGAAPAHRRGSPTRLDRRDYAAGERSHRIGPAPGRAARLLSGTGAQRDDRGTLDVRCPDWTQSVGAPCGPANHGWDEDRPRLSVRLRLVLAGRRAPLARGARHSSRRADFRSSGSSGGAVTPGRAEVRRAVFRDGSPPAQGIAAQIGVVYENQYLHDKVRADADVRRHVLARLEARSVSLLKECPVCGMCYDSMDARCAADGAELELTLPVERTLDGKYRLERALGRGGMGVVFEATDLRLQRQVAAKVMMGSLFGDQSALRRFEREARAAARLDHAHITRVYDYGTVGSDGAYLIMEIVAGLTWRAELQRAGTIEPARAAEWFRQLLEGLEFAHQAGIVHRDLKPENVMVVPSSQGGEQLKIMDFGLAKVHEAGTGVSETLTVAGVAMGTLGYMAPEALTGGQVDARADIFAIGVMLVEALTGARPFAGRTPQEVITSLLQTDYHLPGASAEARALDAVVQRCLAKDPRNRYASAGTVTGDLCLALARCDLPRVPPAGTGETPTVPHTFFPRQ